MKKKIIIIITIIIITNIVFLILEDKIYKYEKDIVLPDDIEQTEELEEDTKKEFQVELKDIDGKETNYSFKYEGQTFTAIYTEDNWKIIDSYKIKNKKDMMVICKALIDIHPIHGKDMNSYRTVEDMAYEWEQHNIAYSILPDDNTWKENAKDVDLNPEDQGKSIVEFYEERTGIKLNLEELLNEN